MISSADACLQFHLRCCLHDFTHDFEFACLALYSLARLYFFCELGGGTRLFILYDNNTIVLKEPRESTWPYLPAIVPLDYKAYLLWCLTGDDAPLPHFSTFSLPQMRPLLVKRTWPALPRPDAIICHA